MSKLICDICGTSYPDTATQCPICGCVRPAESSAVNDSGADTPGYTYVKGGRFSKSNVKKRNNASSAPVKTSAKSKGNSNSNSKSVTPLIVVFVLLCLIVACMIGFIVYTLVSKGGMDGAGIFGNDSTSQSDNVEKPCTGITLSKSSLSFHSVGEKFTLKTICSPTDTTDVIAFSSSNESVATVSYEGEVVCVGPGEAVIYVYCGEQMDECLVQCLTEEETEPPAESETEKTVTVKLSRENITDANFPGYSWDLYEPGDIKADELTWVSENPSVATVDANGVVTAVAEGSSVIRVYYDGEEVACCYITCDFSQQEDMPQEGSGNYVPYIPIYGVYLPFEEDRGCYSATLRLNEWIDIRLRDPENPDDIVQVVWTIEEGDCQMDLNGAGLTATSDKTCKIKAEYNGKIYYILLY